MLVGIIFIDRRLWTEVGEKVQRTSRPARKQSPRSAGKKAQQIGLGKTVQVDDKIKLLLAHIFDDLKDSQDRKRFESISQPDAVDLDGRIGITGHLDDLRAWSSHNHGNPRVRKALAHC